MPRRSADVQNFEKKVKDALAVAEAELDEAVNRWRLADSQVMMARAKVDALNGLLDLGKPARSAGANSAPERREEP